LGSSVAAVDYMATPVHQVRGSARLDDVWRRLRDHGVSCMPVVDPLGRPIGVVSRFDLLRVGRLRARTAAGETLLDLPDQPVQRIVRPRLITVENDATLGDAAATMIAERVHRVFVRQGGTLAGVVSTKDVMRAVADAGLGEPIGPLASRPVVAVPSSTPLAEATDRLSSARVQGLVVLDDDGRPVGLFGEVEALEAQALAPEAPVSIATSAALVCVSSEMPLWRAARLAADSRARRVLTVEAGAVVGVVTGLDFARRIA